MKIFTVIIALCTAGIVGYMIGFIRGANWCEQYFLEEIDGLNQYITHTMYRLINIAQENNDEQI